MSCNGNLYLPNLYPWYRPKTSMALENGPPFGDVVPCLKMGICHFQGGCLTIIGGVISPLLSRLKFHPSTAHLFSANHRCPITYNRPRMEVRNSPYKTYSGALQISQPTKIQASGHPCTKYHGHPSRLSNKHCRVNHPTMFFWVR